MPKRLSIFSFPEPACRVRSITISRFNRRGPISGIGPFDDLVSAYDLKVNHKPVVLVDLFSETGGLPLMKRHPVRQRYRMVELQRWRDKRGLKFHLHPANWPFNARLADGVVIAAIEAGFDPDRYLQRAFAGVWEDQLNLADPAVDCETGRRIRASRQAIGRAIGVGGDQRGL